MSDALGRDYLESTTKEFRSYKRIAEKAVAQLSDEQLHAALDPESNTVAVILRHVGGNLRSRFTDFLTADGEKPDRARDREFEEGHEPRTEVLARWEEGWGCLFSTLQSLSADDLGKTVVIRGEPHTVVKALQRALAHVALHVGQVIYLAKHLAGPAWATLSVPRGQSDAFNAAAREKWQKRTAGTE